MSDPAGTSPCKRIAPQFLAFLLEVLLHVGSPVEGVDLFVYALPLFFSHIIHVAFQSFN